MSLISVLSDHFITPQKDIQLISYLIPIALTLTFGEFLQGPSSNSTEYGVRYKKPLPGKLERKIMQNIFFLVNCYRYLFHYYTDTCRFSISH